MTRLLSYIENAILTAKVIQVSFELASHRLRTPERTFSNHRPPLGSSRQRTDAWTVPRSLDWLKEIEPKLLRGTNFCAVWFPMWTKGVQETKRGLVG